MHVAPARLDPPYHWVVTEDGAYLHFNYGCVASVTWRGGVLTTVIRFQRHEHQARCGSVPQGMRWIERWLEKQAGKGPPGLLAKGPRWYDRCRLTPERERELQRSLKNAGAVTGHC